MLSRVVSISKSIVSRAFKKGVEPFNSYVVCNKASSTIKGVVVANSNGTISIKTENSSIIMDLYLVKELPMFSYICIDIESVFWGMSLICGNLKLSKLGKFDNLLWNLDAKEWNVIDILDDYFMHSSGNVGVIGTGEGLPYKTENLVLEYYAEGGGTRESALVYLDSRGITVKLNVTVDFKKYLEDIGDTTKKYSYLKQ